MLNQLVIVENKRLKEWKKKRLNFEREANEFDGNGLVILGLED